MTDLEQRIFDFANQRWPERDRAGRLRKLGEEFGELAEALVRGDETEICMEAADCGIVLADLLALSGCSLTAAMEAKMVVNNRRKDLLCQIQRQR